MSPEASVPSTATTDATLADLRAVLARNDAEADHESAEAWIRAIEVSRKRLDRRDQPVVFIGEVGVGKSSLLAIAARLLVTSEDLPTDRASLKKQSLLAIGSGRTTVCEVRVRAADPKKDAGALGLEMEPVDELEFHQVVDVWAEDEWRRRQADSRTHEDSLPTPQEVSRALRMMAGYPERIETYRDGSAQRRRTVQPLDEIIPKFESALALAEHLRERIAISSRQARTWWWPDASETSLRNLKEKAELINAGNEPTAMLPIRMTFVVPSVHADVWAPSPVEFDRTFTLVDTRGLDAGVGLFGRSDLQEFVSDERALLVLCAPFKSAPGAAIRAFLVAVKEDARWRAALSRTLVVLLDQGDSEQVNGANGDRIVGQEVKISECRSELADLGLDAVTPAQWLAIDVLADSRERLLDVVHDRLTTVWRAEATELQRQIADAKDFLRRRGQTIRTQLQPEVDHRIREVLSARLSDGAPLREPLAGLFVAFEGTRYASVVYASCRRKGAYRNLNVYEAVKAEASRAMTAWLAPAVDEVLSCLAEVATKPGYAEVSDFISLRKQQFSDGRVQAVEHYASAVEVEVRSTLGAADDLWRRCCNEWGQGGGFKHQVLQHLGQWSKTQTYKAHQDLQSVREAIPFWPDVARPARAPQFTLHVRNLRALRQVDWTPAPVSLLIGANGAGKSTTLLVLRLLQLTFDRGLSDATRIALGGSHNLASWGKRDDEKVEVGLQVGAYRWQIALNPREASVDPIAEERLFDGQRIVFERDSFGALRYGDQVLVVEPGPIGLRALVDRGTVDVAVRSVATLLQRIGVYQDPDLALLRKEGADVTDNVGIRTRGENSLSVLHRWQQSESDEHRYAFVIGGMKAAFPASFSELEFQIAGKTLTARTLRPGSERVSWLADEANGVLQLLVLLCEVASAQEGGVVAIDEPENGLHPYALRVFLRKTEQWATQHHVTVVLATHSTVLLDQFSSKPEAVFVMSTDPSEVEKPISLSKMCNPDWLAGFKLGDLYEQGELGNNDDAA